MPCQVEGFDLAGLIGTSILWSQEYQRGSSGFFSFLRCQFLGIGERAGSEGSISGMSDFGFFWRFGLAGMNGWERVRVVATTGWRFAGFPVSRRAPFAWRPGLRALASCYWGEVSLSHGPSRSSLSESDRGRPVVWHPDPSRRFRAAVLH